MHFSKGITCGRVLSGFTFKQSKLLPLCSILTQPLIIVSTTIVHIIYAKGGGVFIFTVLTLVELYRWSNPSQQQARTKESRENVSDIAEHTLARHYHSNSTRRKWAGTQPHAHIRSLRTQKTTFASLSVHTNTHIYNTLTLCINNCWFAWSHAHLERRQRKCDGYLFARIHLRPLTAG
jgi:hypothetical protein